MAGIHCFYRRILFLNTSRLFDRNGALLQLTRKRHHLVVQMSSLQNLVTLQKPLLVYNPKKLLLCRWASTVITELKDSVSADTLKVSKAINSNEKISKEETHLNEPVQLSKESEITGPSSDNIIIDESLLPPIPSEVPETPVMDFISMGLKEPTFQSYGLGSWWPSGIIQQVLEFLHISLDLPWWEAILTMTLVIRCALLPLNIKCRRESIISANDVLPHMQALNNKINEAKIRGDFYSVAIHNQELQKFVSENKSNLFGFLRLALIQGPLFISMYYALKGMANVPVESLKTGGLFWFSDLSVPDPYFILPCILAGSLLCVIESGIEGSPAIANSNHILRWTFRGIPIVVLLVSLNFASCLTWYWAVSNFLSLCLVGVLKVPVIKKALNIPELKKKSALFLNEQKKGFFEGIKEGMENARLTNEIRNRERMNLTAYQRAGNSPIPRTFKKNPLMENNKKPS